MANYVMVLMIGIMVFAIGAGLIKLNHYYAVKRSNGLARFITTDCKKDAGRIHGQPAAENNGYDN